MGRRKKAQVTEMIEPIEVVPEKVAEPAKRKPKKYEGEYTVNVSSYLNVREGAGKDNKVVGRIPDGGKVTCNGKSKKDSEGNVWLEVDAESTFGYCMLEFLTKS